MIHPSLPIKLDRSFIVGFRQVLIVFLTTSYTLSSVTVRSVQLYEGDPFLEPVVLVLSYRRQRIWEVITVIRIKLGLI